MRSILEVVQGAEHRKPRGGAVQGGAGWRDRPDQKGFAGHALNGLIHDPFIVTRSLSAPGGLPSVLSPLHASPSPGEVGCLWQEPHSDGLEPDLSSFTDSWVPTLPWHWQCPLSIFGL